MPMIYIGAMTNEERQRYAQYKAKCKLLALVDPEKQTRKKAIAISAVGNIRAGICPTCNHCLIWGDLECEECFQKITWY